VYNYLYTREQTLTNSKQKIQNICIKLKFHPYLISVWMHETLGYGWRLRSARTNEVTDTYKHLSIHKNNIVSILKVYGQQEGSELTNINLIYTYI